MFSLSVAPIIKDFNEFFFLTLYLFCTLTFHKSTFVIWYLLLIHEKTKHGICKRTKIFEFNCPELEWVTIFRVKLLQIIQNRYFTQPLTSLFNFIFFRIKTKLLPLQPIIRPSMASTNSSFVFGSNLIKFYFLFS